MTGFFKWAATKNVTTAKNVRNPTMFDGSLEMDCLDTCLMVGTAFGVLEILDRELDLSNVVWATEVNQLFRAGRVKLCHLNFEFWTSWAFFSV
jgi:hypothetical protein